MKCKALILCGGWDGHEPKIISGRFKKFLEAEGFDVCIEENLQIVKDLDRLNAMDLFIPVWTMCKEELGYGFFEPLLEAVGGGLGIAGCHGGMCDAFRNNVEYQWLTGANWVSHPGCDEARYRINIISKSNPITEGINDFDVASEQYYLHVDPVNEVLATTRFPTVRWYHSANGEVDVPQIWTRKWGYGRVFYNALGHHDDVFNIPEAWELMKRGLLWAAGGKKIACEKGLKAEDWKNSVSMY
ncbi:MAG: ThuA domain-containing protein [Treponema sp.]|jgi:type 1 glutamine amidotransferase|nr:ThuA domain-containing protein [Treponema sp.]